ncbi:3-propionate hydroxylase [Lineolata rhizophorae]|uniref:3-propionate hydroxylase n=1 Tax=Lineolata rhizophorae TaxID=578093 RepID=A0A6A6PEL9_9PEZI|nr:3-propionate hydroxylase [Lineolata rhizophorae]
MAPPQVSVLIVGGGPVGLITAYQLAHTLPPHHTIRIVEKHAKTAQDAYGRAITLFPRSAEMLDQLGLADELAQRCFACRSTASYDRFGHAVKGRGWEWMERMGDTRWDFALVLRQKYQEEIFRARLAEKGVLLESQVELVQLAVDEARPVGSYRVTAVLEKRGSSPPEREVVKCKYVVGADGGRSFVRRALNIPFDGSSTEDKWVRIDGVVETDMPSPRCYAAIESPTHGNVLWAALDHGATRIGFAFTAERQRAYANFDEAAAVREAVESVKPFQLRFKQVDWYTVYVVGQRIARRFSAADCVFLAGDACHTHSSGAAQGMNTGLHDAVNLGWKLSLVLRGEAAPELLRTYEAERRPNVEKLIKYDKDISRLMTMQLPEGWTGDLNADPNEVLGRVMAEAATFSSGLGIFYEPDRMLNVRGTFDEPVSDVAAERSPLQPGQRGPDVELKKPGTFDKTSLHKETPNRARFHAIVFAGDPSVTASELHRFSSALRSSRYFSADSVPLSWLVIAATKPQPSMFEALGSTSPIGKAFYDPEKTAHKRYGVVVDKGAVFVLRPDGWIGTAAKLNPESVSELEKYFRNFIISSTSSPKL